MPLRSICQTARWSVERDPRLPRLRRHPRRRAQQRRRIHSVLESARLHGLRRGVLLDLRPSLLNLLPYPARSGARRARREGALPGLLVLCPDC